MTIDFPQVSFLLEQSGIQNPKLQIPENLDATVSCLMEDITSATERASQFRPSRPQTASIPDCILLKIRDKNRNRNSWDHSRDPALKNRTNRLQRSINLNFSMLKTPALTASSLKSRVIAKAPRRWSKDFVTRRCKPFSSYQEAHSRSPTQKEPRSLSTRSTVNAPSTSLLQNSNNSSVAFLFYWQLQCSQFRIFFCHNRRGGFWHPFVKSQGKHRCG